MWYVLLRKECDTAIMNRFQEYIIEVEDQEWLTRIYYMTCNVFNEYDAKFFFVFFFFYKNILSDVFGFYRS